METENDSTHVHEPMPTVQSTVTAQALAFFKRCTPFEQLLAGIFVLVAITSLLASIRSINYALTTEIPTYGGSFVEGMIGSPRFVNPVLATSETDRTLTMLVYSGLMKVNAQGILEHDLAESFTISDDGKVYTFLIREDAVFHDGARVTPEDVVFTIEKIRDPIVKSPHRGDWEGVVVETGAAPRTIVFKLEKPYAPFVQNTALGILPKHLWKSLTSEEFAFSNQNIAPIGSGPYAFVSVANNAQGIPYRYELHAFDAYKPKRAYTDSIFIQFYHTESDASQALIDGTINTLGGISAEELRNIREAGFTEHVSSTLPRVFALFFNQVRSSALAEHKVRLALQHAIDRTVLVNEVFDGRAVALTGPFPSTEPVPPADIKKASELLDAAGWTRTNESERRTKDGAELTINIATVNTAELKRVAQYVADTWSSLGIDVKVSLFETGDLNQSVLRPRNFDILLFGEITGREPDLFAFWHSSQKADPGLNIAQYQNKEADELLEKARSTSDMDERKNAYQKFSELLEADVPAVFLYAPRYTYILPSHIHAPPFPDIIEPHERFSTIAEWYAETERVWSVFTQ